MSFFFYLCIMKKILVIQTASIGDVILATPILEALNRYNSDFQIDLLVKKGTECLFTQHPFLHRVFVWDKNTQKYGNLCRLIKTFRKECYDIIINLQRFLSSGVVTILSKGKHTIGFDKNPLSCFFSEQKKHILGKQHETQRNLELLDGLGIKHNDIRPRLYPSEEDFSRVETYKHKGYITVSPSSLWFTKTYPEERWLEFINLVPQTYTVCLLGGKSDHALCERLERNSQRNNIVNLAGKLSLLSSAALMKDAAMNYVNDSAPLHLCSAVNAKVTSVFCSTVPTFGFGPLSEESHVVESPTPLPCRPCGLHGHKVCPKQHFLCGYNINPEMLLETLLKH